MAQRQWTPQQQQSIEARGGTLLVAAAAGSGKTAVLVERILRLITEPPRPVSVDRLLVVTFTKAAAAEMQQRLSKALAERAAAEPDNALYQQQLLLLPRAQISTIHGFCAALLREQAAAAGLPPRFQIVEPGQAALLQQEALDEVLEAAYQAADPAFLGLVEQLSDTRSDTLLRSAVLQTDEFMQAQAQPEQWLHTQLEAYTRVQPLEQTAWMQPIAQRTELALDACLRLTERAVTIAAESGLEGYRDTLRIDRQQLTQLAQEMPGMDYDALQRRVAAFSFTRLPPAKAKDAAMEEAQTQIKALRDLVKKRMAAVQALLDHSAEECRRDIAATAPTIEALGRLVERYRAAYTARKRQRKWLDYGDLEHESLRLLLDAQGQPTALAQAQAQRFEYILVDECQDINGAQDALFRALSRQERNLFLVGDVKQSIYGFRQAMPEIFTARRDGYTPYDPKNPVFPATVTLGKNFRSRSTVTGGVNFLFRQLMQRAVGGVDYDEREALVYGADYPPAEDTETEFLLLDGAAADGSKPGAAAEARAIGRVIQETVGKRRIQDGEGTRPLAYGDICILLRGWSNAGVLLQELGRMGIPACSARGSQLLDTPEVMTALSLLRVIDNPLREVELTAVLLSPLFGFSADDAARLRTAYPREPLYVAVQRYAQEGEPTALRERCGRLYVQLTRLRTLAVSLPADRLLERIDRELGLTAVFSARRGGRQRVANLQQLDGLARSFEQDGFRGLSAFVRYMDQLQERGKAPEAGGALYADRVRIMSVHHSKGLEYPVVFLAGLSVSFGGSDARERLLLHANAGIGMRLREAGEKRTPLTYRGVQIARQLDERAEELRVWYVAMTRAREKLYLVIAQKDLKKTLLKLELQLPPERALMPDTLLTAASPAEWMLAAALRHPAFAGLRADPAATRSLAAETDFRVTRWSPDPAGDPAAAAPESSVAKADEALTRQLAERMAYRYPYGALAAVPAKLAASALSHEAMRRSHIAAARPAFLQEAGLTPAQKGTALHTFMQFAEYSKAAEDPAAEAERLTAAGFLTARQQQALRLDKLRVFFAGALYARMAASPDCRREFHFTVEVPAGQVVPGADTPGETVVVQGIADCVFREGDALVLVDYKTDRVKTGEELALRYRSQLQFYKQALEPILGLPVKEALLYSFSLEQAVPVALP